VHTTQLHCYVCCARAHKCATNRPGLDSPGLRRRRVMCCARQRWRATAPRPAHCARSCARTRPAPIARSTPTGAARRTAPRSCSRRAATWARTVCGPAGQFASGRTKPSLPRRGEAAAARRRRPPTRPLRAAGRADVWTVMRGVWEAGGDTAEARRGLFALPFISGPSLTNVRPAPGPLPAAARAGPHALQPTAVRGCGHTSAHACQPRSPAAPAASHSRRPAAALPAPRADPYALEAMCWAGRAAIRCVMLVMM